MVYYKSHIVVLIQFLHPCDFSYNYKKSFLALLILHHFSKAHLLKTTTNFVKLADI